MKQVVFVYVDVILLVDVGVLLPYTGGYLILFGWENLSTIGILNALYCS